MITRHCTECGAEITTKSGQKTACGAQHLKGSCAWERQKKVARAYYNTHLKTKKHKPKKIKTEVSDWCEYSCNF
jgi:hypothetical protein